MFQLLDKEEGGEAGSQWQGEQPSAAKSG
jgi:hypothetical protein